MMADDFSITKMGQSKAVTDVLAERVRQVEKEGFTPAHDDQYQEYELAFAAGCYAMGVRLHGAWPWSSSWWKPSSRRRNLIKAAALLLAEIERVDRGEERIRENKENP